MKKKKPVKFMQREAVVLTQELKDKCEARTKEIFELAKKLWKIKYVMPTITYDLKSLTCGMAHTGKNLLRFHPIFLAENPSDYLLETVPHEVAHLLVPLVGPILRKKHGWPEGKYHGHGNEWRAIMVAIGRGPKPGQTWKDVIKHAYDPSSIPITPRRKHGPRKPGGKKVGEIIAKIKTLKPDELEALKERLGLDMDGLMEMLMPPTPEEIAAQAESHELHMVLASKFPTKRGDSVSVAGWARNVILKKKVD